MEITIPKDYSELLVLLISKVRKLAEWKETDDANDYRAILEGIAEEFEDLVLDRNAYELWLDSEENK